VKTDFGRLDILVNNAGIGLGAPSITAMSLADFRRQQAVNVEGVFLGVKQCPAADARGGLRRLDHQHVVGGGLEGLGDPGRLLRDQGGVRLFSKAGLWNAPPPRTG